MAAIQSAIQWLGSKGSPEVVNIGPLALIAPLLDRLDLAAIIDRHLPADPQLEYSHGKVLTLLLAARLAKPTALVNVAGWAKKSGAEFLWDIPAEKLNDDRIGRSLDAFFQQRHSIQAGATLHALRAADLSLERIHFDPTHVLFEGTYASSRPRSVELLQSPARADEAIEPAHITRCYQVKDQKAVQVANAAVVDALGAVPIFSHVLSGNQNGHTAIHQHFHLLRQHLPLPEKLLLISDRGTFSVGHTARLAKDGYHVLCSAMWRDFRPIYDNALSQLDWREASYLSVEQKRRRDTNSRLPRERYEIAVLNHTLTHKAERVVPPTQATPTQATLTPKAEDVELPCRLIFVRSSADAKACRATRQRVLERIRAGLDKIADAVNKGHPCTKLDKIPARVAKLLGKKPVADAIRWELQTLSPAEQAALPPPKRGCRRATHRFVYAIDEAALTAQTKYDGLSVLVTTAPITQSADSLFSKFKEQNYVELGHHQFKTPLAVAPVFLKSPERVEALICLLQIALQAYQMLERLYRQSVAEDASPQEKRMTSERLLRLFEVQGLVIRSTAIGDVIHPMRLSAEKQRVLDQLAFATPEELLGKSRPKAPMPFAAFEPVEPWAQGCGIQV